MCLTCLRLGTAQRQLQLALCFAASDTSSATWLLPCLPLPLVSGEGMEDFMAAVQQCREEYEQQYKPELQRRQAERAELERRRQAAELERLQADRDAAGAAAAGGSTKARGPVVLDARKGATLRQLEEEEEELRGLD